MWDRRAQYLSNHDGDTVKMVLDQGFGDTKTVDVRLFGVFAPELNQQGGAACRNFLLDWMNSRLSSTTKWSFIVTTTRMKVADREQKSLDRYVGVITTADGRENLNMDLINFIRTNNYEGGTGS